jgi:tight adherence protein B
MSTMAVSLLVASGALSVVWAAGRALSARRLEASLSRIEPQAGLAGRASAEALLERLGARILSTRAGALIGGRIAAACPAVPPAQGAAVAILAALAGALAPLLLDPGAALVGPPATLAVIAKLVRRQQARRREAIERQLPDVLALQAGALRAGHSIAGSLGSAGRECGPPLGRELVHSATELDLGVPLEEALDGLARRCGTRAVQPWIAALLAGRSTGGDVSRALTSLAARARDRAQLRSELRALTAQGRLSGTVVSLAPVAFFTLTAAASWKDARALYGTGTGFAILVVGAVLDAAGLLWIRRIAGVRA